MDNEARYKEALERIAAFSRDEDGHPAEPILGWTEMCSIALEALAQTKESREEVDPMFVCDKHGVGDFPCQQCKQEELTKAEERGYERGLEEAAKVADDRCSHLPMGRNVGAAIRSLLTPKKGQS